MSRLSAPIVVAVDLSPNCIPAAQAASWLARELAAPVILLFAREPGVFGDWEDDGELHGSFMSWADEELRQLAERLFDGAETKIIETANAPSEAICDEVDQRRAQLVVMGTHGRTALTHALYGSTATSVVRHASCDVLTVRPPQSAEPRLDVKLRNWVVAHSEEAGIRRILCPVDFSPGADSAFRRAMALAERFSARLDLVHALPAPFWPVDDMTKEKLAQRAERAAVALDGLIAQAEIGGVKAERHVVEGSAADEILLMVDRTGPDLVVLGTHGRTGVKRWTIGSVAERIVRSCHTPVWTVRHAPV